MCIYMCNIYVCTFVLGSTYIIFVFFSHSDFTTSRIIRTKSRQFLAHSRWVTSSTSNGERKTEKILDTGGFLTSSKKRSGETFPDAKIYNQARSPTVSGLTWPHWCPGKYLLKLLKSNLFQIRHIFKLFPANVWIF